MYHPKDKSFWGYSYHERIDAKLQLVLLGYKWTDVAENYPAGHFSKAEWEARKRRKGKENMTSKKPGEDKGLEISGYKG
jgi:hypothetical protein